MRKGLSKVLAFALSICMVVGLVPATRIAGTVAEAAGPLDLGEPIKADSASSFTFPDVKVQSGTYYGMSISVSGGTMDTTDASSKNVDGNFATWNWGSPKDANGAATEIAKIKFSVISASMTVTVTLNTGGTTYLPSGAKITAGTGSFAGHYYLYVKKTCITWHEAYNNAKKYSYNGMKGYLATITTAEEHAFLAAISSNENAWTSGTSLVKVGSNAKINDDPSITAGTGVLKFPDDYPNSNDTTNLKPLFYWACGPEAGDSLLTAPWTGGEPNKGYINDPNYSTDMDVLGIGDGSTMYESCVQANYDGGLNDYAECSIKGTGLPTYLKGYFVEFGGYSSRGKTDPGGSSAGQSISGSATVRTSDIKTKVSFTGDHYGIDITGLNTGVSFSGDLKSATLTGSTAAITLKASNGYYFDETFVSIWNLSNSKYGVTASV